jgi:hypothetical protein
MLHGLRLLAAGTLALAAVLVAVAAPSRAASDPKAVETETITVPPGESGDGGALSPDQPGDQPADTAEPSGVPPRPEIPGEIPTVEYDASKLPTPVARLREQIIAAATTGDPEALRTIVDANGEPPLFGPSDTGDPIGYLKLQSGDEGGREILAILIEVLDAGYVHVDVGTPDEMYIWPYFARYPIDKLTPPQLVELFKLVFAGDYEEMISYGQYTYFRAGISPDGTWKYFLTDD